jgi:hypothetical protein
VITPKQYILKELNAFVKAFSNVCVRYEYNERADIHFVEVTPSGIFHDSEAYIAWESEMWDKFVAEYPRESICFTSDDEQDGIENAEFTLRGIGYARNESKAQRPAPVRRKAKAQAIEYA